MAKKKDVIQIIIDAVDNASGMFDDIEKTARRSMKQAEKHVGGFESRFPKMDREIDRSMKNAKKSVDDFGQSFPDLDQEMEQVFRKSSKYTRRAYREYYDLQRPIKNLPDHLKPFERENRNMEKSIRRMGKTTTLSFAELQNAALKSRVEMSKITKVSKSGKQATKTIQGLTEATRKAQAAAIGLNRNGTVKISAKEATKHMQDFEIAMKNSHRELERLKKAGDFGSYQAGMKVAAVRAREMRMALRAASGDARYMQRVMADLGWATSDMANRSAVAMEAYKDRFLRSVDRMNARTTLFQKQMDLLGKEVKFIPFLDKGFMRIGNRLEEMAKKGTAANLAISQLGRNASMADLRKRIQMINQGLSNLTATQIGSLVIWGLLTFGLAYLATVLDKRVVPAFENFKNTWLTALTPLAEAFTTYVILPFLKALTAIGNFINYLNDINPALSQLGGMFLWVASALMFFLSPLAVGIGLTGGMRAAFTALWTTIKPFVLGFLRVAGAAMFWATVIVGVVAAITHLWKTNENFRNAVMNVWNAIRNAVMAVVDVVKPYVVSAWESMTGGANSALQTMGDKVATVFNWIADVIRSVTPYIVQAVKTAINIIKNVWNDIKPGVQAVVQWLLERWNTVKSWFQSNGPGILDGLKQAWETIKPAVTAVVSFIQQIWGQLVGFFNEHGAMILQALTNVWNVIGTVIQTAMTVILAIMQFVWPFVEMLIVSVWNNVKGVIQGAIGVITSIIQIFSALFTGNWSALWDGILNLLKSAWQLIWNGFQLLLYGRLVKGVMLLGKSLKGIFTGSWSAIKGFLTSIWSSIVSAGRSLWNGLKSTVSTLMKSLGSVLKGIWNSIKGVAVSVWNGIKAVASSVWNGMKSTITGIAKAIWNAVKSTFNSMKNTVSSIWKSIRSAASSAWNGIKSVISNGVRSAWNTIKGYAGSFLSAGKGLLDALARGIRRGLSSAISAVKGGMQKIRSFLPFSPAKEGPLSDLDKSGESFFPTWADGVTKQVRPMVRTVESGMEAAAIAVSPASQGTVGSAPVSRERPLNVTVHFHGDIRVEETGLSRNGRSRFAETLADRIDEAMGRIQARRQVTAWGRK